VKRVRAVVSGRVQGVWFRASTRDKARELGVTGTVRNLPDGDVEVVAEGEEHVVEQLLQWLWHGPPFARVDQVEVEPFAGELHATDFRVRY